ncbi:hypothetical protein [Cupriavidus sp. TMH.W2]|uniref:hypothetical protein n=1 Tax=Cupriavidus sp. TMH.W2 TaxID=3434465 RepID=UPI003D774A05
MIRVEIAGFTYLGLDHLILPLRAGVLAADGRALGGVPERLAMLARQLKIHVLADPADARMGAMLDGVPCKWVSLPHLGQAEAKRNYVEQVGVDHAAAIGHGRGDVPMLEAAALGIAIFGGLGLSCEAARHADLAVRHTVDALGLLLWPDRLIQSLTLSTDNAGVAGAH